MARLASPASIRRISTIFGEPPDRGRPPVKEVRANAYSRSEPPWPWRRKACPKNVGRDLKHNRGPPVNHTLPVLITVSSPREPPADRWLAPKKRTPHNRKAPFIQFDPPAWPTSGDPAANIFALTDDYIFAVTFTLPQSSPGPASRTEAFRPWVGLFRHRIAAGGASFTSRREATLVPEELLAPSQPA